MTRPGIKTQSRRPLADTLLIRPIKNLWYRGFCYASRPQSESECNSMTGDLTTMSQCEHVSPYAMRQDVFCHKVNF